MEEVEEEVEEPAAEDAAAVVVVVDVVVVDVGRNQLLKSIIQNKNVQMYNKTF